MKLTRNIVFTLAAGIAISVAAPGYSQQRCTVLTAPGMNSAAELCGCVTVTQGFLRSVTRKDDFPSLLAKVENSCPKLAVLLTDLPTAAPAPVIHNPPSGRGPVGRSTPPATVAAEEPEEVDDYEAPSECYSERYY